ncbi:hydroxymethylpyrimidine/phosphomethylpyrimidine kinase [Marinithermofilum abyssi]|uniref:pyridoxal kinase n=1 Tax=Marinithermofilum abyssi TaxID=1571185 RepID=A0A8J2YA66_9BACL|nr:pyridoxine/pyridoxal/pyridoxamine kinase [Marinithermofilum abyssi]GGE07416.1 hydroxymethylpyrimidine/phosphomethylpyrimidine kinase [Marinithermofilum abyssi]
MNVHKALTIAGSDSSGGAGIQADLKTFQERDVYGMTALTTIVAMDPDAGWAHRVTPLSVDTLREQMKTVLKGIGVDAMKTGMLGSVEIIEAVAEAIDTHDIPSIVIDPVMVCKGTDEVLQPNTAAALRDVLIPRATVTTPNLFEASHLSGVRIQTVDDMKEAALRLHEKGPDWVLIKGGAKLEHEKAVDLLYDGKEFTLLEEERLDTPWTHGAGCTYSAAITAELAKGKSVPEAVRIAKAFVTEAIRHGFPLNQYVGPVRRSGYRLS